MGRVDALIRHALRGTVVVLTAVVAVGAIPVFAGAVTPVLLGNVEPALPATLPTTVAVVAYSAPVGADVAIIVRNGTTHAVDNVQVTATAKAPDGSSVVRTTTRTLVPETLAPGALAIGNLDFGKANLPTGATFTFKVTTARAKSGTDRAALEAREALLSRPMEGPVAQELGVTVANLDSKTFRGPIQVAVMCFGEARNPVFLTTAKIKKVRVASGETTPVTVKLRELCPTYMVGASGG